MFALLLTPLLLGGVKPEFAAAMRAERELAAAFSDGWFDAHRKWLAPSFQLQSIDGTKPLGRNAYIDRLTQYRNAIVTGKQTVRLVRGEVKEGRVNIRISVRQQIAYRENGRIVRDESVFAFDNVWTKTPMGYRLLTMKPVAKSGAKGKT